MMTKLKHTAVLLAGAMVILVIVVWGIKHNMQPVEMQLETDNETEVVTEEPEATQWTAVDYDIASNMKIKDKAGVKTITTDHFTLTLTHGDSWDAKVNSKTSITLYNKALYKAKRGGKLVTILAYDTGDESYDVLPDYEVIGAKDGKTYIAAFPTDVQFDENDRKSNNDYMAVFEEVSRIREGAAESPFALSN